MLLESPLIFESPFLGHVWRLAVEFKLHETETIIVPCCETSVGPLGSVSRFADVCYPQTGSRFLAPAQIDELTGIQIDMSRCFL